MENETDNIIESQNNEDMELDLDLTEETPAEEKPVEKPQETPEAKLARLERQAIQLRKKLGQAEEKPESKSPVLSKSSEFGLTEKTFLKASDIKTDEYGLVKEWIANTGKAIDDVVENKYFLQELKDFREAKTSKEAVPTGTKRSSATSSNTSDYWYNKYITGSIKAEEIPNEYRQAVFNRRAENEKSKNPFGIQKE
jgi:hypothetical protein